jgi:hypothetical protein
MFRRFIAFFLLIALISSNFSRFYVYAGFKLNRSYIAEKFCINKSRPWLHCDGKCYFMKKIKQAEDNEKKQEAKDNSNRTEFSFFQEAFRLSFIEPRVLTMETSLIPFRGYIYTNQYIEAVFRPPKKGA